MMSQRSALTGTTLCQGVRRGSWGLALCFMRFGKGASTAYGLAR